MLIGNGRLTNKIPLTMLGRDWNGQIMPGTLPAVTQSANFGSKAALPSGYYQPHGWMLPRKGGNLRAGQLAGAGTVSAGTLQSGYNIGAALAGDGGITSAPLGLIVSIAAAIVASGGISSATTKALASMVASLTGTGNAAATAQGLADLGATLAGQGTATGGNTALMDIAAQIRGYGDLTPEGIRDAVWQALLANYQDTGSAGKALSSAGSGGVDYGALSAAVRDELQAELARIIELAQIHGLVIGADLVVTETSRTAGPVAQTIASGGGTTTVTRTP